MEKKEVEAGGTMMPKATETTAAKDDTTAVKDETFKETAELTAVQAETTEQTAKKAGAEAADVKAAKDTKETVPGQDAEAEVVLQYRGYEINMETVNERIKSHYYAKGYAKGSIENMQVYLKPEDFTAYYVINDGVVGKVHLF